jgi:hypothetical protein
MRKLLIILFLIPFTSFGQNTAEYDTTRVRKTTIIVEPFIANGKNKIGLALKTELFTSNKILPNFLIGVAYGNNSNYALTFGLKKYINTRHSISYYVSTSAYLGEADFNILYISNDGSDEFIKLEKV